MSHLVFAIDPGTYKCGYAWFINQELKTAGTISSLGKERQGRLVEIANGLLGKFNSSLDDLPLSEVDDHISIVCEEPLLRGKSNNVLQRLLGAFEWLFYLNGGLNYIAPSTVKRLMGHGDLDKLQVALSAGEKLQTSEEQNILAELVTSEQWDATDAIAIGLCFLMPKELKSGYN